MKHILIVTLFFVPFTVFGQVHTIKGTVTAFNKYPLENVVVKAKKSKTQVVTNERGEFQIEVSKKDVLQFMANGFQPYNIRLNNSETTIKPVKANLIYNNRPSDYGVAIGYGHMKKEDLSYAIDHFMMENNDFTRFNNIYDLIQSKVAGVRVMQENGQKIFVIRGISSINSSIAALLVVDGVVVSDLNFLNVHDIASIQVLKDSSAAIYGSRGANGVIMVSTKRGGPVQ
jgi:TonB-dependent SusC/RagA subfamily outer membrane receptor